MTYKLFPAIAFFGVKTALAAGSRLQILEFKIWKDDHNNKEGNNDNIIDFECVKIFLEASLSVFSSVYVIIYFFPHC